ncbi:hypothetical protein XU18_0319 [Perkinsela sp. CCAP 1560/4]|nr:hypothetical protein XU18_0319 [Perkinsela sp. CCAP 1560/4]|eukprot:KNH09634.1 hypothetical protein XU18_0319 [Perkinsela sp. CCAP 1560/4]
MHVLFAITTILAFEFLIRIIYYGLVFTFAQHLLFPLGLHNVEVNGMVNAFYAVSSVCALFVGLYADIAKNGLYRVLKVGSFVFVFAVSLICLGTYSEYVGMPQLVTVNRDWLRTVNQGPLLIILLGIFLFAVSYGSIKTTTAPIIGNLHLLYKSKKLTGADTSERDRSYWSRCIGKEIGIDQVFRLYYWIINAGGLIGILLIPAFTEQIAVHFTSSKMSNSTMTWSVTAPSDAESLSSRCPSHFTHYVHSYLEPYLLCTVLSLLALACLFFYGVIRKRITAFSDSTCSRNVSILEESDEAETAVLEDRHQRPSLKSFLSFLLSPNVAKIFCILPVFWLISNQQSSNFILQAHYLHRPSWISSPSTLNAINSIMLLIVIPAMEFAFFAKKSLRNWFTSKRRVVGGLMLSCASMTYAVVLQLCILRCGNFDSHNNYIPHAGRISIFFQVPLYLLQTLAEALTSITVFQLAYTLSPPTMKAFGMALYMFTSFIASLLGIMLAPLTSPMLITYLFAVCAVVIFIEGVLFHRYFPDDAE